MINQLKAEFHLHGAFIYAKLLIHSLKTNWPWDTHSYEVGTQIQIHRDETDRTYIIYLRQFNVLGNVTMGELALRFLIPGSIYNGSCGISSGKIYALFENGWGR